MTPSEQLVVQDASCGASQLASMLELVTDRLVVTDGCAVPGEALHGCMRVAIAIARMLDGLAD